jgi:hypothetical protein
LFWIWVVLIQWKTLAGDARVEGEGGEIFLMSLLTPFCFGAYYKLWLHFFMATSSLSDPPSLAPFSLDSPNLPPLFKVIFEIEPSVFCPGPALDYIPPISASCVAEITGM